jgi:hypothetical protein
MPPSSTRATRGTIMAERRPYQGRGAFGHVWKRDDFDKQSIDIFGKSGGYHNGPVCVNCGYGFCHHCQDKPTKPCPGKKKRRAGHKKDR